MNTIICLVALLPLAIASDVLEFTDSNFAEKAASHDLMLVEFYAPWCGHCKRLAPEYERAATQLASNDPPVPLVKVDCTAEKDVCSKYGVSGYPTLKIFRNGELSEDYNGPREAAGIVKHMQSRAGPSSKELTSVEETEKVLSKKEYVVIGFFKSADSDLAKTYQKVADSMSSDMRFAHTTDEAVRQKYGYEDTIVLFQPEHLKSKFEESRVEYKGDDVIHKIKSFITDNSLGLCAHRTPDNADKFKTPLVVAYFDVDYVKNTKGTNYWRNRVMKVGKKLLDEGKTVYFAISSLKDFSHELGEFGIEDPSAEKPVVAARDASDKKYTMSGEFSMDSLEQFIRDLLDGKLEPFLKSEPIPTDDGPLKTVVAKNFDEIVNNEDKDVLIEFYAPWCGHCKSLEPKYKELAEKLEKEPEITIAKMDATANDVSKPYDVTGFPTIYFAPKGSKSNPKRYSGEREVDGFIKYLAKEATNELKGFDRSGKAKKTEL
ncbi:hypothetical protein ScPMuIL_018139 [Solemya velum]